MRASVLIAICLALPAQAGCERVKALMEGDKPAADAAGGGSGGAPERTAPIAAREGDVADVVEAEGTIRATSRIEVRAERRVRVAKRLVEIGSSVKRGERMIEVDRTEFVAKLKELGDRSARSRLDMSSLDIQLAHKRKLLERKKALQAKDVIPLRELEEAIRDLKVEENNQAAKRLEANKLENELAALRAQTDAADILAPMTGTVAELTSSTDVNEGDQIGVVIDTRRMSLYTAVDELSRLRIKLGQEVSVTTASDGETRTGKIADIAVSPDANAGGAGKSFQVRIDLPSEGSPLAEGYRATARFTFATAAKVTILPRSAIRRAAGKTFVHIAGNLGGAPEAREVTTGVEGPIDIEITTGVAPGERVLVGY